MGRGEYYMTKTVYDDLPNKVIDALQKSIDPCFEESAIKFFYKSDSFSKFDKKSLMPIQMRKDLGNVYQN